MGGREDDPPLERKDFASDEEYAKWRWKAGLAGSEYDEDGRLGPGYDEIRGGGEHAAIYRGVFGHDRYQYDHIDFIDNLSFGITESAWRGMYLGIVLANCQGFVLNALVNISWSTVGITDDEDVEQANKDFCVSLRKWLKARKAPLGWVWCLENGKTFGLHSHILAHVPDAFRDEFRDHVPAAVATIAGCPAVDDKKLKIKTVKVLQAREDRFISQWSMFRYMSKSIDEGAPVLGHDGIVRPLREVLGLKRRQRSDVWTKRAGVNRMLQEKERNSFFKRYGTPHIGLNGATGPHEVFGDQYLVWGKALKAKLAELKGYERGVRLNLSLDPDVLIPVPEWVLEMWEAESRHDPKSDAAFYLSLFRSPRRR